MVPIIQKLCPSSRYYLKCPYTRTPTRIVVHNTANDAPAANEVSYMVNNDYEISYHYAVDDKQIVQGLPENRNAWASGDGRGTGNMNGIHIEICYSLSGGSRFTAAEKNAAEFVAYLLKKHGWGIEKVTKHQDYDGKYCPHRTLDLGWQRFVNMVKGYMTKEEDDKMLTYEEFKAYMDKYNMEIERKAESSWSQKEGYWEKAKAEGIVDGTMPRSPMTREQAMAVLGRMGLLENK